MNVRVIVRVKVRVRVRVRLGLRLGLVFKVFGIGLGLLLAFG